MDESQRLLHETFTGAVENVFHTELGIADQIPINYVTRILLKFTHTSDLYIFSKNGHPITELIDIINFYSNNNIEDPNKIDFHIYLGDFSLYFAGMFPEAINKSFHISAGKFSYDFVQKRKTNEEKMIYENLAKDFEAYVYGLNIVSHEFYKIKHPFLETGQKYGNPGGSIQPN